MLHTHVLRHWYLLAPVVLLAPEGERPVRVQPLAGVLGALAGPVDAVPRVADAAAGLAAGIAVLGDARRRREAERAGLAPAVAARLPRVPMLSLTQLSNCLTFEGSFSSVSTALIARKGAFCSIFRVLQALHSFAPLGPEKFSKFSSQSLQIVRNCSKKNTNFFPKRLLSWGIKTLFAYVQAAGSEQQGVSSSGVGSSGVGSSGERRNPGAGLAAGREDVRRNF